MTTAGNTRAGNVPRTVGLTTAAVLSGALAAPGVSMADGDRDVPDSASVQADIDGDGGPELITVRDRGDDRVVSARFADHSYVESAFPADVPGRLQLDPRVADLGRDGADDVVVTIATGANTRTLAAFTYLPEQGLVRVTGTDGVPFAFHDGGGATSAASYTCHEPVTGGATFTTVRAERTETGLDGVRTRYAVRRDTVLLHGRTEFHGAAENAPVVQADPAGCAPA
ncbi:hypothetical protein GCM10009676_29740 [Prauserella halophila]|uniref:VCBS repeat-containing protein n=1 Tax=Prauserella halophila TaxID=185641 RepID=A0ABP4H320_9PSEU|nr:hypothetical protein [Prauserella halophila]MCP2237030.1 hypothetical protein [Prauserella halophila]